MWIELWKKTWYFWWWRWFKNTRKVKSRELLNKYKLSIPEANESLALINQESRKLISNVIMETSNNNIISEEAFYGETDLTEKLEFIFLRSDYILKLKFFLKWYI